LGKYNLLDKKRLLGGDQRKRAYKLMAGNKGGIIGLIIEGKRGKELLSSFRKREKRLKTFSCKKKPKKKKKEARLSSKNLEEENLSCGNFEKLLSILSI